MNDEYTKFFDSFHKQRLLFSNGKAKYKKCKGCSNDKIFEEKNNKLKLNCGDSDNSNECGEQYEIILPHYKDYFKEKVNMK